MSASEVAKKPVSALRKLVFEYLEHLEVERNLSALTIRDYAHYLRIFTEWCETQEMRQIEKLDLPMLKKYRLMLARTKTERGEKLTVRTQSYYLIALRAFLKWLTKNDRKVMSPEKIELPKAEAHQMSFLSVEQMQRVIQMPDVKTLPGLRDRAILEVLFSTGLRVSELVSLDREQVNLETREFGVIGKGRRQRVVFLSSGSAHWVDQYLRNRGDTYSPVFIRHAKGIDITDEGEKMRLTTRSVQRIVEKYRKLAHLPIKITPHSIRHSFATDLLRNGAGLRDVQEMLGHKNLATTQIYTHVTQPQLKKVHEQFHSQGESSQAQ